MNNKGVTLTELMIVIVVMGIIALFAVPAVTQVIGEADKNDVINEARLYVDGASQYCSLHLDEEPCKDESEVGDDYIFYYDAATDLWQIQDESGTAVIDLATDVDGVDLVASDNPGIYISGAHTDYDIYMRLYDQTWKICYMSDGNLSYGVTKGAGNTILLDYRDPKAENNSDLVLELN